MTLEELVSGLESLGYPVAYSHFDVPQTPPFICYIEDTPEQTYADNITYHEIENINIELYTTTRDFDVENAIKEFLTSNELPFEASPMIWIDSEKVFQKVFYISLV